MCIPVAVAGLIISAVGTAASFIQQSQQAKAAQASANAANEVNLQAYARQQDQINDQATEQMSARAREGMIERAKLRVAGAESGIVGNSTDQLERQSLFNEGSDMAALEGHRKDSIDQSYLDAKAGSAAAQSRMNSIKQPSLIGAGLQIGSAYVGYKTEAERVKRRTGPDYDG